MVTREVELKSLEIDFVPYVLKVTRDRMDDNTTLEDMGVAEASQDSEACSEGPHQPTTMTCSHARGRLG